MSEEYSNNQTQFSFEEPLLEDLVAVPGQKKAQTNSTNNKTKIFIAVGLTTFALMLVFVGLSLKKDEKIVEEEIISQDLPAVVSPNDPLAIAVKELQLELQEQDPARRSLTFPSINLEIWLDPKPRQ